MLDPPPLFTKFIQFLGSMQPSVLPVLEFTVEPSIINSIRDRFASMNSGRPCTVFEAVTAVLWRCRTRVIMSDSDPEALMVLTVVTNARKYVGAKEGYYGNCTLGNMVTATAGAVGNGDLMDLVKMIRSTKNGVPGQSDLEMLQMADWYNIFSVSSWQNLFSEGMDFGAGGPARLMGCTHKMTFFLPSLTACIPCKDDDYNMVSVCVKEEHATAFLHELAHTTNIIGGYIRSPL
uniref:Uncharacterized protein n=1 Tax=Avena sativa TaxID=4498 RepID=A0ACD5TR69_AVESA